MTQKQLRHCEGPYGLEEQEKTKETEKENSVTSVFFVTSIQVGPEEESVSRLLLLASRHED